MARALGILFMLGLLSLNACGGRPDASLRAIARATAAAPAGSRSAALVLLPTRPDGRLPVTAIPQRYRLSLRIDPTQPRFSGVTDIEIEIPQPTLHVVLHARDMNVSRALARIGGAGGDEIAASASLRLASNGVVPEELVLTFARPLPAGTAELEIAYDAPFASDLAGLYRVQEDGRWYAFTQFEATDARRAFPCFDEPGFKTPYDVAINSPQGTLAFANTPERARADAPDGLVVHAFETSPPLPSYLVAFAVGDFDVAAGQKEPFAIRVITTKGKATLAGLALDAAAALVAKLQAYFGLRYPYAKLDLVAVPDFAAGAMENPGLLTFRDVLLLVDAKHATTSIKRSQAVVIAHELAHQWFGDLVTMQWWDDIWLNEGFATWAEAKMIDAWKPTFGATIDQIASVQHVMDTDAMKSARAVREPVRSTGEAKEGFDGITYDKGAAVLRMLESWLGPDIFRRGVQHYLEENAWKTARADDLFKALDFVSAQRVGELASSFLDRPGVPEVLASWTCGGSGSRLELRESEWRPLGGGGDPARTWKLPVCITSDAQKTKTCFTLGTDPITRDLGPRCPMWVYPNAEQAGYYRFVVERAQLLALAAAQSSLGATDRLGLLSNAWAGVRQAAIEPSTLFEVLSAFDAEMNRHVVDQIVGVLQGVDHMLVDDDARSAFQKYASARLAAKKRALGWEPSPKEDDDRALERRTVLWAMGEIANDKTTLGEAEKYCAAWLRDPERVPNDVAAVAVPLASLHASDPRIRLQELRAAAKRAKTPEDRVIALRAMGAFEDPAVLREAFELTLADELKLSELHYIFGAAVGHRVARPVLYAWEKESWAKLRARMPGSLGGGLLVEAVGMTCSPAERDDARAFSASASRGMEGVKRRLEEALESADLCIALRRHGAADVTKYLKGR